jgi:hypothetical protein
VSTDSERRMAREMTTMRERVLDYIREHDQCTGAEIIDACEMSVPDTGLALSRLHAEQKIIKVQPEGEAVPRYGLDGERCPECFSLDVEVTEDVVRDRMQYDVIACARCGIATWEPQWKW